MTEPKTPKTITMLNFVRPIGFLIGCMLFALFPHVFASEPTPIRRQVTVVDIEEYNGGTGEAWIATYSNRRKQTFSVDDWPELAVGDEVTIEYNPQYQIGTTIIKTGTPPKPSSYDLPWCIAARVLIVIICVTIIFLFYEQVRLITAARKDASHDQTTV